MKYRQRNRLMRINLIVSFAAASMGTGAFGAGVFGMNLLHGWEEHPTMFYIVTTTLGTSSLGMFLIFYVYYRKSKNSISTFSRLSQNVTELRYEHQAQRLFSHSNRSKLLYNYRPSHIETVEQYEQFLRSSQVDFFNFKNI